MAVHKEVSFLAYLLVLEIFILVSAADHHDHKKCTKECGNFAYGVCPRSEGSPKNPICTNCCSGYKGCHYYSAEGHFICEGKSDPRKPNACPRNCDPKIAYSKCPLPEGETIIKPARCTTCCTGYKGCYYFDKDGKFACEGERTEPKAACTLECDPKVAYMTCPSTKSTKLSKVCVNCCTAKEGCKLYGHDESLLCTGNLKNH